MKGKETQVVREMEKRKKKEKKYDRFEEEDSEDEHLALEELKSPSKNKRDKIKPTFKFPVRKEKTKEKDDKKGKEDKERKREEKEGKKTKKDKKKSKHTQSPAVLTPSQCEAPVFGVPLAVAVERSKSHDGIEIPAVVRECIDYIEECGLSCEGIYRISGVKSKVQHLKDAYNRQEDVHLYEQEPSVVSSLLKQFLRDVPEPVLTHALMAKFEEASVIKNKAARVSTFQRLVSEMPVCNRLLLSWVIVHMNHVIQLAKENKMSLQNVSIVLSPTMQISHRVLYVLFSHVDDLFGNVVLRKYVPPLKPAHSKWSLELPDNVASLEEELAKQESLLHQLHEDLQCCHTDPVKEEQLWEVQRVVTQLKRKIKTAKKNMEMGERRRASHRASSSSLPSLSAPEELHLDLRLAPVGVVTAVVEPPAEAHTGGPHTEVEQPEPRRSVKFQESNDVDQDELKPDIKKKPASRSDDSDKPPASDVQHKGHGNQEESVSVNKVIQQNNGKEEAEGQKDEEKEDGADKETVESQDDVQAEEVDSKTADKQASPTAVLRKDVSVLPQERPPSIDISRKSISPSKVTSPTLVKEVTLPRASVRLPASNMGPKGQLSSARRKIEARASSDESAAPGPLPPFMSTALLQPMKAQPPRHPSPGPSLAEKQEKQLRWEKLRELEEELLGGGRTRPRGTPATEDITDDRPLEEILEEEYALLMEEEELLAIADELKQKMATEQSEMERLTQEIQELQYLRQDSDLEDLSSASEASDDSEDEDDLHDLLTSLIQDNQGLEMRNSDMCQKIHEERMICLSVKLQIRLLQQKQMEEGAR